MSTLIGIVGGSAAGKTLIAKELACLLGDQATILSQDNYYSDIGPLTPEERLTINFDCPEAFDQTLFIEDLKRLKADQSIRIPTYDFATCKRTGYSNPTKPNRFVLIEGLFLYTVLEIRDLLDHKFYVDAPQEVRVQRILHRDLTERGRTRETALANINRCVLPMHTKYIEPFEKYAEWTVQNNGDDPQSVQRGAKALLNRIQK